MKEVDKDQYIKALESELSASIEREKRLSDTGMSIREFVTRKFEDTGFYRNYVGNPNSGVGKVIRAPRSFYRIIRNPEVRKSIMQKKTLGDDKNFLDPWDIDVGVRKRIAKEAIANGKKVVLYCAEKPDSATFRYRCYNTFQATLGSQDWQAVYFFKNEMDVIEEILPKSAIVVFGRQSGQEKNVERIVKIAHSNHIKVGLDIDDLVFDMKYLNTFLDVIGGKASKSYWMSYFASSQFIAKRMDFFITTNDFLARKLKESFNKPCKVIRNSLNTEQVEASMVYVREKKKPEGFTIGYFSGTPTHAKDFAVAEPELVRFLKQHDDAVLNVVGYMDFSATAKGLIESGKIKFLPAVDFRKLQRLMSEVDVNIAPLLLNDFTNCKSELKFFEAAAVETTTIASPTYAFKKAIKDGENGFLAKPGEWYDKMEYLYEHPEENKKIAVRAREYALKYYYGAEFLKEVESVYEYFSK